MTLPRTYDAWKLTSPDDDRFPDPTCEVCGRLAHATVQVDGTARWMCDACWRDPDYEYDLRRDRQMERDQMIPRITDDDRGTITATHDGKVTRSWTYTGPAGQLAGMINAREYIEGWCDGSTAEVLSFLNRRTGT